MAFNISLWKIFGIFSSLLILLLFFSPMIINLSKAVITGDWTEALKSSGGRLFALDRTLVKETEYLLEESSKEDINTYDITFHIIYGLSILFVFFFFATLLFKVFSWMAGLAQFSPISDILFILLIIGLFFTMEFLYTVVVLDEVVYPLEGVIKFTINLPKIVNNLLF